jgi:uncharacterized phage-associated protein
VSHPFGTLYERAFEPAGRVVIHVQPVSAHDLARELRRRLPDAGDVKLHKLLYYCQGWHLARHGEPMFVESVEAWSNGPVIAEVWRIEKHNEERPPSSQVPADALETVEFVIDRYGRFDGRDLIQITHSERPWLTVSSRADPGTWDDQTIERDLLQEYFVEIDELYSLRPMTVTPDVQAFIDEAKAEAS